MITLINPYNNHPVVEKKEGYEDDTGEFFPRSEGVVRFVKESNYADNFGFQWNKFQKTQIDRVHKNLSHSRDRFFTVSGWDKDSLKGLDVLEVGSGAGRFSQVILDYTEANLYSLDYSDAVAANYRNNGHHSDRFHLFQASIYEMPFKNDSFDKVFCFGVLQHTPDFKKSVQCLIEKAKPGGEIVVDFYAVKGWWSKISAKYILRPITKRMSHKRLLRIIERNAGWMIKCSSFFQKIGIGKVANRFLPICDIEGTIPPGLSKENLKELVILDTFDMFSPEHDHPQRVEQVAEWFKEFNVEVTYAGLVSYAGGFKIAAVRGIKK
ncbi:MAG: class I SAM-dependent methyltransferase [Bacteroidota bacterium]|nr:class I SAM-dependent methyltransferase [Bacteroidota bacterium]